MKILDSFGVGGSFTEYYAMDYTDDVVLMGHDGPGHIAIAEGKTKVRPLEVYHGKVGRGLSVEMSVKHGPVTLLSVVQTVDGQLMLLVAEGRIGRRPDPRNRQHQQPLPLPDRCPPIRRNLELRTARPTTAPSASATSPARSRSSGRCWECALSKCASSHRSKSTAYNSFSLIFLYHTSLPWSCRPMKPLRGKSLIALPVNLCGVPSVRRPGLS